MSTNHDHSSLLADSWHDVQWRNVMRDGVIHVSLDPNLPPQEHLFALETLQEIDELIGTPIHLRHSNPDIRIQRQSAAFYAEEWGFGPEVGGVAYYFDDGIGTHYATWSQEFFDGQGYTGPQGSPDPFWQTFDGPLHQAWAHVNSKPAAVEYITAAAERVIAHEILHTFGLSHPDNDPNQADWSHLDSLMSYDWGPGLHGVNSEISELDGIALQEVWGVDPSLLT